MQAFGPSAPPPPAPAAWRLLHYRANHDVVLGNLSTTVTCRPAIPLPLDGSEPEEVTKQWLGALLQQVSTHMQQFDFTAESQLAVSPCAFLSVCFVGLCPLPSVWETVPSLPAAGM